jgi:hypothetical protein
MRYRLFSDGGVSTLTVVDMFGTPHTVDSTSYNFDEIVDAVRADAYSEVFDLIDLAKAAGKRFSELTERVSVRDGNVYFDGDIVHNSLADAIVRALSEGAEFIGLVNFLEKIHQNPRKHSRENLYDWLNTHEFTITNDGDLVGYKGVSEDMTSISAGPGIVNGVETNGHLDNSVGNVVSIARSYVQHDPSIGCSTGLHVGTWDYASSFGPVVVKVLVNPRDVVSVPTDCNWAKMRVSRYKVVEVLDNPVYSLIDPSEYDEWDEDWDEDF